MNEIQIYKPFINEFGVIYMFRSLHPEKLMYSCKCTIKKNIFYPDTTTRIVLCLNDFHSEQISEIYIYIKDQLSLLFDIPIDHESLSEISTQGHNFINSRLSKKLSIDNFLGYRQVLLFFDSIFINNDGKIFIRC